MALIPPLTREDLPEQEELFQLIEAVMGFVPNSMLTMAHRPEILQSFAVMAGTINAPGTVGNDLKRLVAEVSSKAAGCQYCVAHTAHQAERSGVPPEKLAAVWSFETSPLFSEAEKAALGFAMKSSLVPSLADEADMANLRKHFSDGEVVEIVGVISLFGFLNRWNAAMGTTLEEDPLSHAEKTLGNTGWTPGIHGKS